MIKPLPSQLIVPTNYVTGAGKDSGIALDDIVAFRAADKYIEVIYWHEQTGPQAVGAKYATFVATDSLKSIVELYGDTFMRVHRKGVVRKSSIIELIPHKGKTGFYITLKSNTKKLLKVDVSRRHETGVRKYLRERCDSAST